MGGQKILELKKRYNKLSVRIFTRLGGGFFFRSCLMNHLVRLVRYLIPFTLSNVVGALGYGTGPDSQRSREKGTRMSVRPVM